MAVGLGLVGLAGYVLLAAAGHTLPPGQVATVTSVYLLANILGPGLYSALEQETSRAVAAHPPAGFGHCVRSAAMVASALGVGTSLVLLAVAPVLVPMVLGGNRALLPALVLSTTSAAVLYLIRGTLAGRRRFTAYAATLSMEGVCRLLPVLAIAGFGFATATGYGFAFAAGFAVAMVAALPWARLRFTGSGAGETPGTIAKGATLLGVATLLLFTTANIAPVVVTARMPVEPAEAAAFAQAFVLVRVPLLMFTPVEVMVLPGMADAAERGALTVVRDRVGRLLTAVVSIGGVGTVVAALLGRPILRVLFGVEEPPSRLVLALLGLSTVLLMAAQALQPVLVALRRHRAVTIAWVTGTATLMMLLLLPIEPITAALAGQLVGCAVVAAGCLLGYRSAIRRRVTRAAQDAGVPHARSVG